MKPPTKTPSPPGEAEGRPWRVVRPALPRERSRPSGHSGAYRCPRVVALAATLLLSPALALPLVAQALPADTASRALSLDEALRLAAGTSEAVAIARGGLTTAEGQQLASRAERLPQINSSFSYSRALASQFEGLGGGGGAVVDSVPTTPLCRTFVPDPSLPPEQRLRLLEQALGCSPTAPGLGFDISQAGFGQENTYNLGFSFTQPLYMGGRIAAQNEVADAAVRSAALEVTAQNAQLVVTVTEAYYDALLSARLMEIAEESLAQAEETLRLSELAFQVGDQAEYDVLRARVARNNQRNSVVQQRSNRDLAFLALKQQLNLPLDEDVRLTTELSDDVGAVVRLPEWVAPASDTATAARIAVQQAATTVEMQEAQVAVARAQGRPNVSLTSNYGVIAYPTEIIPSSGQFRDDWSVGLQVSLPLFNGGRVRGSVVQAQGSLTQAQARLLQVRENAAFDSRSKLELLETARASLVATAGTVDEAQRAYEIAQLRYQQGLSNLTEVSDAQIALSQAQADRAQGARNLYVAQVQLLLVRDLPLGGAAGGVGTPGAALPAAGPGSASAAAQPSGMGAASRIPSTTGSGTP